jgi:hypothetical protein
MAAAIIVGEANNSKIDKGFTLSQSKTLRTLCGLSNFDALAEIAKPKTAIKPTKWEVHDDLQFVGQKEDNDSTYFGLVPVIGGNERPDLAIMSDTIQKVSVMHYNDEKDETGEMIQIDDALRTAVLECNTEIMASRGTWGEWWELLAKKLKGKSIGCLTYRGRRYDNGKVYYGTEMVLY